MKNKKIVLGIILIAMNLRLPITMIPPLMEQIKLSVKLPSSMAGLLTSIPLLTFAIMSPIIVKLGKKIGNELSIFVLFSLLVIGSFLRIIPTMFFLFFGTFLIGMGIDSGNVLIPAVIKGKMPNKISLGTSLYTVSMMVMASVGSALSGFLIIRTSLANTLFVLSLTSIVGLLAWLPNVSFKKDEESDKKIKINTYRSVWKQPIGWLVTLLFGLQSLISYSLITWIPSILIDQGVNSVVASTTLTIFQFAGIPFSLITPMLVEKKWGMNSLLIITFIGFIGGTFGLFITNMSSGFYFFIGLILGFASSAAFNLTVVFFGKKTTNPYQTVEISGMAQSFGYLLAAVGPFVFGVLHSLFNTWSISLYITIVLSLVMIIVGYVIYVSPNVKE
ncbi:CynX/NimT family MFS transporter [Companilactobacillus sp. DQM5]|uniref:CynX/NimT family MFS transporter n=1 Tax=Companilactobacillus sp. DQM5 TaxID=3463359 RepID=UPI004059A846